MAESKSQNPDKAQSGAPAVGHAIHDRFSADEIFQRIMASAIEEVDLTFRQLLMSAIAAGLVISLTFLAHANFSAVAKGSAAAEQIGGLLYPLGFIFLMLGRYQLYTEQTLPPVGLALMRLTRIPTVLWIFGVTFLGNAIGAGAGALLMTIPQVFDAKTAETAAHFSVQGLQTPWEALFIKGIFAGGLVASLVWIDHAARDSVSRFFFTYIAFFAIPANNLYHVSVTTCDCLYGFFAGKAALSTLLVNFLLPVGLGNTIGGIILVAVVNYSHTRERWYTELRESQRQLSVWEMIFGKKKS
jgi:formate-nitrite transporter family protein